MGSESAQEILPCADVQKENDAQENLASEEKVDLEIKDDERIAKIQFKCSKCDLCEMVHYYGCSPPFLYGVEYVEDTYVMRDPFQAPPPRWKSQAEYFISIGAHCKQCNRAVCKDPSCSFFYVNTICLDCAPKMYKQFPTEVQAKLTKQLSQLNSN